MSRAYEGYLSVNATACQKVWSYHAYHQDCPFDDIDSGELIFAVYVSGYGTVVPDPDIQESSAFAQHPRTLSEIRAMIKRCGSEVPTSSESVKIHSGRGMRTNYILFSFSTTQETWSQLDQNSCILLNISMEDFEPENGLDWRNLIKTLSNANTQHAFRDPFPLQIKKINPTRLEELYPKADFKKYSKVTLGLNECFENIHLVFKFSRKGCKAEGVWIKSQQLMGNKLLAEGLLSDFAIKAGGKTIPCHRSFLAGRSAVFAGMFKSNMAEVENQTLKMEDMSAEGVEGFLKYVYTGNLVGCMEDSAVVFEILRAGHKYEMKDLEFACKTILESTEGRMFDAASAFEIYQFCGNVDGLAALQTKAVRVLKENAEKFKKSGEIGSLFESIQSADARKAFNDWICNALQCA